MCTYSGCFRYFSTMRKKYEIWSICEYKQGAKIRILCNKYADVVISKRISIFCPEWAITHTNKKGEVAPTLNVFTTEGVCYLPMQRCV